MEIETITELINEHMYDRLNESDNSTDGKNMKQTQNPNKKPIWEGKSSYKSQGKQMEYDKQKQRDNLCGQCGIPNWTEQNNCPAIGAECEKSKKKGRKDV